MTKKTKKVLLAIAAIGLLLTGLAVAGLHAANKVLKQQIELALGPESEIGELVVGLAAIEVRGLRIRAPKGWPTEDALHAERVVVTPDLAGLMSARVHVPRITIEGAYLSVWRTKNGKLRLLPSLMEKADPSTASTSAENTSADISIGRIVLQGGVLELFDSSIRQPAHKLRLETLQATVDNLQVPSLASQTQLELRGTIKGVQRDGKLALDGNIVLATRDSNLKAQLEGVDLLALQPYLIKASETGVKRGTLDLALH